MNIKNKVKILGLVSTVVLVGYSCDETPQKIETSAKQKMIVKTDTMRVTGVHSFSSNRPGEKNTKQITFVNRNGLEIELAANFPDFESTYAERSDTVIVGLDKHNNIVGIIRNLTRQRLVDEFVNKK